MLELFISAFATLFVVIDPPGCAPIFASLTSGTSPAHRRAMALRSVLVAGFILLAFAIFGEAFPMGIPMIAGPGSIASAMLLVSRAEGLEQSIVVIGALLLVLLLTLAALLLAAPLMRLVGARMEAMITRLLGVILAALAVQFVLDGVRASLS